MLVFCLAVVCYKKPFSEFQISVVLLFGKAFRICVCLQKVKFVGLYKARRFTYYLIDI